MNQTQIKYARERAAKTLSARKTALEAKHTVPAIKLTSEEKLEAIKAGKFKIDTKSKVDSHWWHNSVIFTAEKPRKFDQKAHDAELKALQVSYDKLIDELVLGDNETALALLREFETA